MPEIWEETFGRHGQLWGPAPSASAVRASEVFAARGVGHVLIPGLGYGRNARPFMDLGMAVTGIEISETAIGLARSNLGLGVPIHHGSVAEMPFDGRVFDGIFCFGLVYLLDAAGRAKLYRDCAAQLAPGGTMVFTAVTRDAPMYGRGERLGDHWFQTHPGMRLYFYAADELAAELAPFGQVRVSPIGETAAGGTELPFHFAVCRRSAG